MDDGVQKKNSLVKLIIVRVLPVAALLLLTIWIGARYFTLKTLAESVQETLSAQTGLTAVSVGHKLDDLKEYSLILSSNDLVINGLIDMTARENYLPTFFQSLRVPGIQKAGIFLTDYKGRFIASNFTLAEEFQPFKDTIIKMVMQGQPFFEISSTALVIASPVYYNGLPEGVLIIQCKAEDLEEFFYSDIGMLSYSIIKDTNDIIFSSSPEFLSETIKPGILWLTKKNMLPGYNNLKVICGVIKDDALGQYKKLQYFLLLAIVLDIGALFIGIYMSARFAARSLGIFETLIDEVRQSGDFQKRLPEKGATEMVHLARAFNTLFDELQVTTVSKEHLEELVIRRTKKLEEAQDRLVHQAMEAGRAQLSAMVLHNIGNALTPVIASLETMNNDGFKHFKKYMEKCYLDLKLNKDDLERYINVDPRGQDVFIYCGELINSLDDIEKSRNQNIDVVKKAILHISEIITFQQAYAANEKEAKEPVYLNSFITDAAAMQSSAFNKSGITLIKELSENNPKLNYDKDNAYNELIIRNGDLAKTTEQLKEARSELLIKALEASRAQIASITLHNIGNAITPVEYQIDELKNDDFSNGIKYIKKCCDDLRGHSKNLCSYISNDERGASVFNYLCELADSMGELQLKKDSSLQIIKDATLYIADILSLNQSYGSTDQEVIENTDLNNLMEHAVRMQLNAIENREILLVKDFDFKLPLIQTDKNRLWQVIVNIIKNAYEAIDHNTDKHSEKKIVIKTFADNNSTGFEIFDSGIGIDPAKSDSLFSFGKSEKGSSGMGLYYCKMFVENHGGTLTLESSGIGKGALVKVHFPAAATG